jgi:hypothetical protein
MEKLLILNFPWSMGHCVFKLTENDSVHGKNPEGLMTCCAPHSSSQHVHLTSENSEDYDSTRRSAKRFHWDPGLRAGVLLGKPGQMPDDIHGTFPSSISTPSEG